MRAVGYLLMQLKCEIVLNNVRRDSRSSYGTTKPTKACLHLAVDKKLPDCYVFVVTSGSRTVSYPLAKTKENGNANQVYAVETLFDKFVHDGKATARLRGCQLVDVLISKADVVQLKAFVAILRKIRDGNDVSCTLSTPLTHASRSSKAALKSIVRRLIISNKKDYPLTSDFPPLLEFLTLSGLGLRRIDSRIMRLPNLTSLDMSANSLTTLEVKDLVTNKDITNRHGFQLPRLASLDLSTNRLDRLHPSTGLASAPPSFRPALLSTETLIRLNLSSNSTLGPTLPDGLFSLVPRLTELVLDRCNLHSLPANLGLQTPQLRRLSLADNPHLNALPLSLVRRAVKLEHIDISGTAIVRLATYMPAMSICRDERPNPFGQNYPVIASGRTPPSLLAICLGRCFSQLTTRSDLPRTVVDLAMAKAKWCPCGRPQFRTGAANTFVHIQFELLVELTSFAQTWTKSSAPSGLALVIGQACSIGCLRHVS